MSNALTQVHINILLIGSYTVKKQSDTVEIHHQNIFIEMNSVGVLRYQQKEKTQNLSSGFFVT